MREWRIMKPTEKFPYWRLQYGFWQRLPRQRKFIILNMSKHDSEGEALACRAEHYLGAQPKGPS